MPDKGGLSLDDILLLWLGLGPSDLLVGPSNLLVSCILSWIGASILIPCMCTVRATEPGFVVPTVDITLEVSMLGGKTIRPYLSMCPVETFCSCVCGDC